MGTIYKYIALMLILGLSSRAFADSDIQAKRLYQSLTGITPSAQEISLISAKLKQGKSKEAALDIIDSKNGINSKGTFYNVTVKNFATPWSNTDYSKLYPLTDLTATVIGWVRDEKQFNKILYADSVYMANGISMAGNTVTTATSGSQPLLYTSTTTTDCNGIPTCPFCKDSAVKKGRILFLDPKNTAKRYCRFTAMSETDFRNGMSGNSFYVPTTDTKLSTGLIKSTNAMYEEMESNNLNLADSNVLIEKSQEVRLHQDPVAIAGLFTTRAWGFANYTAGTNRRSFQSTMKHFFCKNMMSINDTNTPDFRVRRDVDRKPGGTAATFKALCVGCHAVMDAHAGAYAYYSFPNGAIIYNQGQVASKMNHNAIYSKGFITQDDSWINLSNFGQNASFGWGPQDYGNGLSSLAQMYSETKEFHRCMAKTVYKSVCHKEAESKSELSLINRLVKDYEVDNYNMKNLFVKTSLACLGN